MNYINIPGPGDECAIENCIKLKANKDKYCHAHRSRIKKHRLNFSGLLDPIKPDNAGKNNNQYKHGLRQHPLYQIWLHMKDRCTNRRNKSYGYYGGRGIIVCDEWYESAEKFIRWAEQTGWEKGLQIDRKDNDLGYSPENCHFTTSMENSKNRRLLQRSNTTGYCGVGKRKDKYRARVSHNGIPVHIAQFKTAKEAAIARDEYVVKHNLGLPLNFPLSAENCND